MWSLFVITSYRVAKLKKNYPSREWSKLSKTWEKLFEKEKNTCNKHFSLFPQCFVVHECFQIGIVYCFVVRFTGRRPASYFHGVVAVVPLSDRQSVCPCVRLSVNSSFKKTSQKLLTGFLQNFTGMFLRWSSFKFLQIIMFYEEFWLPWQSK